MSGAMNGRAWALTLAAVAYGVFVLLKDVSRPISLA